MTTPPDQGRRLRICRMRIFRIIVLSFAVWRAFGNALPTESSAALAQSFRDIFARTSAQRSGANDAVLLWDSPGPDGSRHHCQNFVTEVAAQAATSPKGGPVPQKFVVSVLGDSLAAEAVEGLREAFKDRQDITLVDQSNSLSGLTRDDYYDWPKVVHDIAEKRDADVVVVMLGINDAQFLKDQNQNLDVLSEKWISAYSKRVERMVRTLRDADIPIFWIGTPIMRDDRFSAEMTALNEIYRTHVEDAGGVFVDAWDAFVDSKGQYAAFGPNIDGETVKLRGGLNGMYFTKAGSRKLAQLVESEIRRVSDSRSPRADFVALPPDIEQRAGEIDAQIRKEMGAGGTPEKDSFGSHQPGPILQLTMKPASSHGDFIGGPSLGVTPRQVFVAAQPQSGRADEFSWPQ